MMQGNPCIITDTATSKTGKHGHAKVTFTGKGIFTEKKYSDVQPGHGIIPKCTVLKKEYPLTNIDEQEGSFSVIKEDGSEHVIDFDQKSEEGQKMIGDFNGGENEVLVTTTIAPVDPQRNENYVLFEKLTGSKIVQA